MNMLVRPWINNLHVNKIENKVRSDYRTCDCCETSAQYFNKPKKDYSYFSFC